MVTVYGHEIGPEGITIAVAVACVAISIGLQMFHRGSVKTPDTAMALLNGASIFPFVLMLGASFFPSWMEAALSTKLSMSIAGGVGLLFVVGEIFAPASLKQQA